MTNLTFVHLTPNNGIMVSKSEHTDARVYRFEYNPNKIELQLTWIDVYARYRLIIYSRDSEITRCYNGDNGKFKAVHIY